jgi:hypothetical protein
MSESAILHKSKPPKSGIFVEYYEGPYGPTILIDTMTEDELLQIRKIFTDLAQGSLNFINLVSLEGITALNIHGLTLRCLNDRPLREKVLARVQGKPGTNQFQWSLAPIEWWNCVNLVDGLMKTPSHNYFTNGDVDDAIVVVQHMESATYRGLK